MSSPALAVIEEMKALESKAEAFIPAPAVPLPPARNKVADNPSLSRVVDELILKNVSVREISDYLLITHNVEVSPNTIGTYKNTFFKIKMMNADVATKRAYEDSIKATEATISEIVKSRTSLLQEGLRNIEVLQKRLKRVTDESSNVSDFDSGMLGTIVKATIAINAEHERLNTMYASIIDHKKRIYDLRDRTAEAVVDLLLPRMNLEPAERSMVLKQISVTVRSIEFK